MTESPSIWLRLVCLKNGLRVSDSQIALLVQYADLLLRWNKKINLVSRKDEENFWANHILHSISLLFKIRFRLGARMLDLGTGGGLPGIPLKIFLPDLSLVMLDATQKKIRAVEEMVNTLGLKDVETVWGRGEDVGRSGDYRGTFDYVVARAVGPLDKLASLAGPFLMSGGGKSEGGIKEGGGIREVESPGLVAMKGGELEEEVKKCRRVAGVKRIDVIPLTFHGSVEMSLQEKKLVVVGF